MTEAAAIAALVPSPSITRAVRDRAARQREAVDQADRLRRRRRAVRARPRALRCWSRAGRGGRSRRRSGSTTLTRAAARSTLGNISSRRSSVICLESCRPARARRSRVREPLVVDQDRGGDQRARRGSRGRPRRRRRRSGSAGRGRRRTGGGCGASRRRCGTAALEDADAVGRPVGGKGLADDPVSGTGPQKRLSSLAPRLSPIMK